MPGALQNGTKPALFSCHLTSWRCFLIQIRKGPAALSHPGLEFWARCTPAASDRKCQLNISIKTGVSAELANSCKPFTRRKAQQGVLVRGAGKKRPPSPVTLAGDLKLGGDQLGLRIKQTQVLTLGGSAAPGRVNPLSPGQSS